MGSLANENWSFRQPWGMEGHAYKRWTLVSYHHMTVTWNSICTSAFVCVWLEGVRKWNLDVSFEPHAIQMLSLYVPVVFGRSTSKPCVCKMPIVCISGLDEYCVPFVVQRIHTDNV